MIFYPSKDTYISEASSELGLGTTMACGQIVVLSVPVLNRILISFDLTDYADVSIHSAVLTLTLTQAMFIDGPHELTAHELTKSWIEGEESWSEASNGDNWTTPGGDFNATAFSSVMVANGATSVAISLLPLVLQKRGAEMNCLLKLPEGSGHNNHFFTCHSREAVIQANRPSLTLGITRACLVVGDSPATSLTVNDVATTNLTVSDAGCAA